MGQPKKLAHFICLCGICNGHVATAASAVQARAKPDAGMQIPTG
jgi:hypothetical protein